MQHGGDLTQARARYGAGDWLDLSTGINPHAWPVPTLDPVVWQRLPGQAELDGLLHAARAAYSVPDGAAVVAAPGTQALIQWLPRLAGPGDVTVLGPTYAEHSRSWRLAGREVDEDGGVPQPLSPALSQKEGGKQPAHLVVVNPNNPDGRVLGLDVLAGLAGEAGQRGGWLVVDESFADTEPGVSAARLAPGHPVIVLRSFGKFYGLAGVRLGFAIAAPHLAKQVGDALGPWAVPGPAIAIGTAALQDAGWTGAMRAQLRHEAQALDGVLGQVFEPAGGTPLYRLVRHPQAWLIHERLAAGRIWVRRFNWAPDLLRFGLPGAGLDRLERALRHAAVHGTSTGRPA